MTSPEIAMKEPRPDIRTGLFGGNAPGSLDAALDAV